MAGGEAAWGLLQLGGRRMKLLVAGSRGFDHRSRENYLLVSRAIREAGYRGAVDASYVADPRMMGEGQTIETPEDHVVTEVVSGGAAGVDSLGEDWATNEWVPLRVFGPDWGRYGKSAGFRRNEQMGDYADALVALWDGQSRGTKHMIEYMRSLGKPVHVQVIAREGVRDGEVPRTD